jgi:hypothetical protein
MHTSHLVKHTLSQTPMHRQILTRLVTLMHTHKLNPVSLSLSHILPYTHSHTRTCQLNRVSYTQLQAHTHTHKHKHKHKHRQTQLMQLHTHSQYTYNNYITYSNTRIGFPHGRYKVCDTLPESESSPTLFAVLQSNTTV